jgi:uncharacterized SAM-dependent methyltransferase
VSVRTVRNWIEAAKQGKLDLDLHTQANKTYVSNTSRNLSTIEQLVERGKKYRPHRAVKTVTPKPEFYQLFDDVQIYDIIRSIETYREVPRQYDYFDGGATYWDKYAERLSKEDNPNLLNSTIELLDLNQDYLDKLTKNFSKVNLIDVGVGNALPVKKLIQHLLTSDKMGRYIGLDISSEMLEIARKNVKSWFGNKVVFEGHTLDINYQRFADLLATDYLSEDSKGIGNIILFLGGTIQNLRQPASSLSTIRDSINLGDIFIHSQKLDTENSRRYFDFSDTTGKPAVPEQNRFVLDMLNIDSSFYDVEMGYSEKTRQRYIRVRLNIALTIKFDFEVGQRVIEFEKGDTILLWRYWHQDVHEIINNFDDNGFYVLQSSQTADREYLLTVSQLGASK